MLTQSYPTWRNIVTCLVLTLQRHLPTTFTAWHEYEPESATERFVKFWSNLHFSHEPLLLDNVLWINMWFYNENHRHSMSLTLHIKDVWMRQNTIWVFHNACVISFVFDIHPVEIYFIVITPWCYRLVRSMTEIYIFTLVPCGSRTWRSYGVTY